MDKEELQRQITKHYEKLPPEAQRIFSSMNWLQTLNALSVKYKLDGEKQETLGTETMLVLLGIIHVEEYENILTKEIALPRNSMDEMLVEINDLIIKTIRPQLIEAFTKNNEEPFKDTEEENILVEETEATRELDARFADLSEEAKDAIKKSDYRVKLYEIAKENQLSVLQMGTLENTLVAVILDKIHPDNFESVLATDLGVPAEKGRSLVKEINEKILKEIRSNLMSLSVKKEGFEAKMDTEILGVAGIEMLPEKTITNNNAITNDQLQITNEEVKENRGDMLNKVENPSTIKMPIQPSISAQKLAGAFKIEPTKTEHTLPTVSPTNSVPVPPAAPAPVVPKIDPYREMPN